MGYGLVENQIRTDRRNIAIFSVILILIGGLLFITIQSTWDLVMPCLYCLGGLLGLYSIYPENVKKIILFQIALVVLIIMNLLLIIASIVIIIIILVYPISCTDKDHGCAIVGVAVTIIIITLIVVMIFAAGIITMLICALRITKRYKRNKLLLPGANILAPLTH